MNNSFASGLPQGTPSAPQHNTRGEACTNVLEKTLETCGARPALYIVGKDRYCGNPECKAAAYAAARIQRSTPELPKVDFEVDIEELEERY